MNDTKSAADEIFELARAQNEAYLAAYRQGYAAGFDAACTQAIKIMENKPVTEGAKRG
jgi:hypothetical protein